MLQLNNSMDVFKLLPKTNCRQCLAPTCLVFSVQVFKGEKQLGECPFIEKEIIEKFEGKIKKKESAEESFIKTLEHLKSKIKTIDLALLTKRLGGKFSNKKLSIKILGKDFSVDSNGEISTDIHVNPQVVIPVFDYMIKGGGTSLSGKWVPFRELEGGKSGYKLFEQRCEKPLKKLADTYTDLFEDMIEIFNGRQVENHYKSDISLILYPLPKVPMLICYWKPEDELGSDLNVFFDSTAVDYLDIGSVQSIGTGIVSMFEKIALKHR